MGESADEIKREIEQQRNSLGNKFSELEGKAKSLTDWRGYFEKSPMTMIGVAFGGGILLASMTGGRRSRRNRYSSERTISDNVGSQIASLPSKTMETWEHVKGALFGVASTKAVQFLDEVVPGFGEHFGKEQKENSSLSRSV